MDIGHNESLDHWQPTAATYLWPSQISIAGPEVQQKYEDSKNNEQLAG